MVNNYQGLHRGPIDHEASSVINVIASEAITMGDAVRLNTTIPATELLARVDVSDVAGELVYGIAVGGDADGIFGTGPVATDDSTRATLAAGDGVVVVTQGRCPARVTGTVVVGEALVAEGTTGLLIVPAIPAATDRVIAIALQANTTGTGIIAVDVQRQVGIVGN